MKKLQFLDFDIPIPQLKSGAHKPGGDRCAMEMVAFLAGEEHSDSPPCTCPVIAAGVRTANDRMSDEQRQRIIAPRLWQLMGTVSQEHKQARAFLAADFAVRVAAPAALRALRLESWAKKLESFPRIVDSATANAAANAAANANANANAAAAANAYTSAANAYAADAANAAANVYTSAYTAYADADAVWDRWAAMLDAQCALGRKDARVSATRVRELCGA